MYVWVSMYVWVRGPRQSSDRRPAAATRRLCMYVSIYLSMYLCIYLSIYLSIYPGQEASSGDAARVLTLGYVSADYREHPVSLLFQNVPGLHARRRFRVVCFSLHAPPTETPHGAAMRARIRGGADAFVELAGKDLLESSRVVAAHAVDILVDMNGYALHALGCVYLCMYGQMYVLACGCVCICVYMNTHIHPCSVPTHTRTHTHTHAHTHTHIHTHAHAHTHTHTHTYTHTYTHTHLP